MQPRCISRPAPIPVRTGKRLRERWSGISDQFPRCYLDPSLTDSPGRPGSDPSIRKSLTARALTFAMCTHHGSFGEDLSSIPDGQ